MALCKNVSMNLYTYFLLIPNHAVTTRRRIWRGEESQIDKINAKLFLRRFLSTPQRPTMSFESSKHTTLKFDQIHTLN
jgi:hypothetical protein